MQVVQEEELHDIGNDTEAHQTDLEADISTAANDFRSEVDTSPTPTLSLAPAKINGSNDKSNESQETNESDTPEKSKSDDDAKEIKDSISSEDEEMVTEWITVTSQNNEKSEKFPEILSTKSLETSRGSKAKKKKVLKSFSPKKHRKASIYKRIYKNEAPRGEPSKAEPKKKGKKKIEEEESLEKHHLLGSENLPGDEYADNAMETLVGEIEDDIFSQGVEVTKKVKVVAKAKKSNMRKAWKMKKVPKFSKSSNNASEPSSQEREKEAARTTKGNASKPG